MFIGHYGLALAAKRIEKSISLGTLFLAVMFADLLFFPLMILGVEKMEVAPGATAANPFNFISYPYSHSLAAALVWGALAFGVFMAAGAKKGGRERINKARGALIVAAAVTSHYFLDVIMHRPDLPILGDDSVKLGLGLWNSVWGSYIVEGLIFIGGLLLYLNATRGETFAGRWGMLIFGGILLVFNAVNLVATPPSNLNMIGVFAIVYLLIFAGIAHWLDRKRSHIEG